MSITKEHPTTIYLAPFHSSFRGYGKRDCRAAYKPLSDALERGDWPYDMGDDPAFFSRRRFRGKLTWGICRQEVRNKICPGDIAVFFSFRRRRSGEPTEYNLCAVATVERKVSQAQIWQDPSLKPYRRYLNLLIRPGRSVAWEHYERGNSRDGWHKDWLWRIADHRGLRKKDFERLHERGQLPASAQVRGLPVVLAENYVIFSEKRDETYVLSNPPLIAASDLPPVIVPTCMLV